MRLLKLLNSFIGEKMKYRFVILPFTFLIITSCASQEKVKEKNPFDALTLKQNLIKGKTTQDLSKKVDPKLLRYLETLSKF